MGSIGFPHIYTTAPRATRDISVRRAETRPGLVITFTSPYHDIPVSVDMNYEAATQNGPEFFRKWWSEEIEKIRDPDNFSAARKEFLRHAEFEASLPLLGNVLYYGMKVRPELFENLQVFSFNVLPDGNIKIGPYVINGPEARYAMTKLQDEKIDVMGNMISSGDPEILSGLWEDVEK